MDNPVRFVQIISHKDEVLALDDDGKLWRCFRAQGEDRWEEVPRPTTPKPRRETNLFKKWRNPHA